MKEQHDNKDEASSRPLVDLLVQVRPLQECNRKIFFIKHQLKFAPVEGKTSQYGPGAGFQFLHQPISLTAGLNGQTRRPLVVSWWLSKVKMRGQ